MRDVKPAEAVVGASNKTPEAPIGHAEASKVPKKSRTFVPLDSSQLPHFVDETEFINLDSAKGARYMRGLSPGLGIEISDDDLNYWYQGAYVATVSASHVVNYA